MAVLDPTDPDMLSDLDAPAACAFCAAPAKAFWVGMRQTVFVCASCSVTSLAHLAADAAVASTPGQTNAARHAAGLMDRFRGEFWKAVAHAVARERGRR
jgi:hypothetical protein